LFSFFDAKGEADELLEERLNDNTSKLKGVNRSFLSNLYISGDNDFDRNILLNYPNSDPSFIDDYIRFRNEIPNFISKNFFLGKEEAKSEFETYFA
jgi:hypothetical protein